MAAITDKLRNYVRAEQPQIEGNDRKFLRDELLKVQTSISLLNTTVTQINTSVSGLTPQAADTLLGNNTASPATPTGLTPAQVKTLLAISAGDVSGLGYFATGTDAANLSGTLNNARLSAVPNSALANSGLTISGHLVNLGGSLSLVAADVGLGNVTNDAQTKAAVVPNTAPSAGQLHVGNAGGTAFGVVSMSGDATLSSAGVLTLGNSGVTATTYGNATQTSQVAIDAKGRVTSAADITISITPSQAGLSNVTNDTQTKAAILPNTAPAAGKLPVGNAGGTAYAPVAVSGDATLSSLGALTVTKTNGTLFGTAATQNTGTSGATIPLLNSVNTWSAKQSFSEQIAPSKDPSVAPQMDFSGSAKISVTTGSNAVVGGLPQFGFALVGLRDTTVSGDFALYLVGQSTGTMLASVGTRWVSPTTTPAANQISIMWDGTAAYRIYNNLGSTVSVAVAAMKMS